MANVCSKRFASVIGARVAVLRRAAADCSDDGWRHLADIEGARAAWSTNKIGAHRRSYLLSTDGVRQREAARTPNDPQDANARARVTQPRHQYG